MTEKGGKRRGGREGERGRIYVEIPSSSGSRLKKRLQVSAELRARKPT